MYNADDIILVETCGACPEQYDAYIIQNSDLCHLILEC